MRQRSVVKLASFPPLPLSSALEIIMSMLCTIFRVTPTQIAAILDDPNLVADLLDAPEVDLPVQKPEGFFARLFFR